MHFSSLRRRRRQRSQGQSLVELALILPVLLLLMMVALDFGRVYLGYINLQNMTRIAANFAANDPDAWQSKPNVATQALYRDVVLNDAAATNCDLPGNPDVVAPPVFTDRNGDGDTNDLGDFVTVNLTCSFKIWTPGVTAVLGSAIPVSANSVFPIKNGHAQTAGPPGGGGLPPGVAFSADDTSGTLPHTVKFMDESGGAPLPNAWVWDFGDGIGSSTQQDPTYTYTTPGTFSVTLTATNPSGSASLTKTSYISVSTPGGVGFDADKTTGTPPLTVTFTDTSANSPTAWDWDFGDGGTSTNQNPTHQYNSVGKYTVTLTVTTATGPESLTKTDYIDVAVGLCKVPDFIIPPKKRNDAPGIWGPAGAGFTTIVQDRPGAPNGNYTIGFQSLTGNSMVPCNSTIQLDK